MKLSFVIPAHNEEAYLRPTLLQLRIAAEEVGARYEVIVVDDGSTDRTARVAVRQGARVLRCHRRQIAAARNSGAAEAGGDVLCFLDADTLLPTTTLRAACQALLQGSIAGGAALRFQERVPLSATATLRLWNILSRTLRWSAGCFLFVRRETFEAVGGFDESFFAAEEIVLSRALQRHGPLTILSEPVLTSGRKVQTRTQSRYWRLLLHAVVSRGHALKNRQALDLWYGRRADPPLAAMMANRWSPSRP